MSILEKKKTAYRGLVVKSRERDHLEGPEYKIVLKWIHKNQDCGTGTGFIWKNRDIWRALVNKVMSLCVP